MENRKQFLGRGWAYPVQLEANLGMVATAEFEDDVQQAIMIILGTSPGERLMRPDFGCGIYDMVFDVIDTASLTRIHQLVSSALNQFEPRIELENVKVDPYRAAEGRLEISITYRVRVTNKFGNLVYPFYFREGGRS